MNPIYEKTRTPGDSPDPTCLMNQGQPAPRPMRDPGETA